MTVKVSSILTTSTGAKTASGTATASKSAKSAYWTQWKASKRGLAHAEEIRLLLSAHWQRVLSRSKVSNPGSRARPDLDQQILKKIARYMRSGAVVALTARKPPVVHKTGTRKRKSTNPKSYQRRLVRDASKRIRLIESSTGGKSRYQVWFNNWDHLSPLVKAMAYGMAIPEQKRQAFTLKLSEDVIAMALASQKGFAGFMQDRIARFLRKAVPSRQINFVFVVEAWHKWEPPHLQGAIELSEPLPWGDDGYEIQQALLNAGGKHTGRSTQLDDKVLYEAAGWFAYLGKRRLVTELSLTQMRRAAGIPALAQKESLIVATLPLRRAGKQWFEKARLSEDYLLRDRRHR